MLTVYPSHNLEAFRIEGPTKDQMELSSNGSSSIQVPESGQARPSQVQVVANVEMNEEMTEKAPLNDRPQFIPLSWQVTPARCMMSS